MRIACCAYSFRDHLTSGKLTIEQFIQKCYEMGLDGVELTSYYFKSTDPESLHSIKRLCHAFGLHICGTAVGSNFAQAEAEKRSEDVAMTRKWIDYSVILGAPCIRVFAGSIPKDHTEEQAFKFAVDCLKEVADYGANRGVLVALENHGGITSNAEQVMRLLDAVNHEWLGINLDFGNFRTVNGMDAYTQFEQCAPHAVTTHAKTTMRGDDGNPVPVDYARVRQIMRDAGYKGYLSIEYEDKPDPLDEVPRFVEYLKSVTQ